MKQILIMILICISMNLYSQTEEVYVKNEQKNEQLDSTNSITIGVLQGGGSLIGVDLEFLISDQFGFQIGAGFFGFGAGLNYHFKPSIRSSFISFQYWNQGIGKLFAQNAIGPTYVYRSKKWFTFQIGFGVPMETGPALPEDYRQPQILLLYSIGAYMPF